MTHQQFRFGSPLVALDIEAPDVQTPVGTYGTDNAFSAHLQTYFQTPQPPPVATSVTHGHAPSSPHFVHNNSINQSLAWETEAVQSLEEVLLLFQPPPHIHCLNTTHNPYTCTGLESTCRKNPGGLGQDP